MHVRLSWKNTIREPCWPYASVGLLSAVSPKWKCIKEIPPTVATWFAMWRTIKFIKVIPCTRLMSFVELTTTKCTRAIPHTAVISCSPSGMGKSIEGRHRILPMWSSRSGTASSTKAIRVIHPTFLPTSKVSKCIKTTPVILRMLSSPFPTMSLSNSLWPFGMRWSTAGNGSLKQQSPAGSFQRAIFFFENMRLISSR